jgi:hypothetical protein
MRAVSRNAARRRGCSTSASPKNRGISDQRDGGEAGGGQGDAGAASGAGAGGGDAGRGAGLAGADLAGAGLAAAPGDAVELAAGGRLTGGFFRATGGATRCSSTKTGFGTRRGVFPSASPGGFCPPSDAPVMRTGTVWG